MRKIIPVIFLLVVYPAVVIPFTNYLKDKPIVEKMGYIPQANALKLLTFDQKQFISAWILLKTVTYYGGIVHYAQQKIYILPEYEGISEGIKTAVGLDPYNADGYFFAQAVLAWDLRRIEEVNALLEQGMTYRDWDFYLPYFVGFNYAFFLKDYIRAAKYYQRVGELTGDALIMRLTSRYLYEGGQTDLAIAYLTAMERATRNEAIKKTFQDRLKAFKEVKHIEEARDRYIKDRGKRPSSIFELLRTGYLTELPRDPYGGTFYLDERGMVRTTSKFVHREQGR